jgi:hypothetical protein
MKLYDKGCVFTVKESFQLLTICKVIDINSFT